MRHLDPRIFGPQVLTSPPARGVDASLESGKKLLDPRAVTHHPTKEPVPKDSTA